MEHIFNSQQQQQILPSSTITNNIIENNNIKYDKETTKKLHTSIHFGNNGLMIASTTIKTPMKSITNKLITTNDTIISNMPVSSTQSPTVAILNNNNNTNIFKIGNKNKFKNKNSNIFRKIELQKNIGTHYNSLNEMPSSSSSSSSSSSVPSSQFLISSSATHHNIYSLDNQQDENIFHILINAYDHFYWQPSEIRTKLTPVCGVELLAYLSALNNNIEWAQKAYDSSGHYRGEILFGNNLWLGQKTFCNEINIMTNERKHFEFSYSVSTISFRTSLPKNITNVIQLGQCLPKSCNLGDIKVILESDPHINYLISLNTTSTKFQILKIRPVPGDYNIWKEMKFKIFCAFIVFVIALISYASWLEIYIENRTRDQLQKKIPSISEKYENEKYNNIKKIQNISDKNNRNGNSNLMDDDGIIRQTTNDNITEKNGIGIVTIVTPKRSLGFFEKIILCFSFSSNLSTICTFKRRNEEILSCVHGIRVLSLLWTIMVHTYLQMFLIGENRFRRNIAERSFAYQVIGNATFSVDSFFFLSGLLVVLIFLKNVKRKETNSNDFVKKGFLKGTFLVFYRYIRLTPAYLFVIIFTEFSLNFVFNRTVHIPTTANIACTNYWWRNILYINNFYPFSELCMIWSWYLANDMQFYILAVVLLIISTKYLKFSIITTFAILFISWGTAGVVSIHYRYLHKVAEPFESFDFLYDKPWQRIGPYIIGMITGYITFKYKTPPKVPFLLNIVLWILSVGLLFILIFGVWNGQLNILATAFYVSVGHTAWGLGLVWITLSCYWDLSPSINKFLSYELFLPLSRLTYCTYLIHPTIMMITSFLMEGPIHLQHLFVLTVFLGNAVISLFVALLISIAFESPVIRMSKIFMKKD
ncbi:uncharacterized protein LOC129611475 [Condylostylus longicornis]|uniref:uncharacterized protein LOC129611475 n=1 Tax=Condylostylus longicornis TaxID=2530218 RepID=UPI00244DF0BA|nr:uncharacterized protein LOC129611475 [Condylostylus longicornis]